MSTLHRIRTVVRLDQLVEGAVPFCHEDLATLPPDDLDDLMIDLVRHGLPDDLEFFVDDKGRKVVVRGHRWIRACRLLAVQALDGFSPDMVIEAWQVIDATPDELLLRSTEDGTVRYRIDPKAAAAHLREAGIADELAASALGLSLTQYRRYLAAVPGETPQS